jgi:Nucleotidyl transferase AbiEii toxin, Type IV TA system
MTKHAPWPASDVIPEALADAVAREPHWFVIGGHAVRCFCPYRPSRDVDFGVKNERNLGELLKTLRRKGRVELIEQAADTVHLRWNGIDVSIFALPKVSAHVEEHRLTVTGLLATKLHAILDRGTRRDFFDLYVTLQTQRLGIIECLRALRAVYDAQVDDGLLLRALTYFEDAEREAKLPHEGAGDWATVQAFFIQRVTTLLIPPERPLAIQARIVDVRRASPRRQRRR